MSRRRPRTGSRMGWTRMIFGEVGEALELTFIFVLMTAALAAMVLLGKWWEA